MESTGETKKQIRLSPADLIVFNELWAQLEETAIEGMRITDSLVLRAALHRALHPTCPVCGRTMAVRHEGDEAGPVYYICEQPHNRG